MKWTIEEIASLRGYTIEWAESGNYFLSRREQIFHSTDLRPPFRLIASVAAPSWKRLAARSRLAQRLLRFQVTNVVPLAGGDEIFVTFDKSVGVVRSGQFMQLGGLGRPCRVLRAACAVDDAGDVFFGEYLANDERGPMSIYRYRPGDDEVKVCYTFPAGSIKHIHGIYRDEYAGGLVCLTGDEPSECRILRSRDGFATIETIGDGDETWRAVSILFSPDAFYYGMDAEHRTNRVYRLDRETGDRKSLGDVTGTVFYSKRLSDDLFFTTTAENAPSQVENVAALWHVGPDEKCRQIASFPKDFWHPTLFQFGTIHFPYLNSSSDELYFHLVGVRGDNRTFRAFRQD